MTQFTNPESRQRAYSLFAAFLCIVPVTSQIFQATRPVFMPSWGITEWLVSYHAGFVRRGLGGEIVEWATTSFRLSPSLVIAAVSAVLFGVTLGVARVITRRQLPWWALLSPAAFGAPIAAGFIVRKDLLTVLLFTAALAVLHTKRHLVIKLVTVNVISISAILLHEQYIFAALPFLALSIYPHAGVIRRILIGGLSLLPSAIVTLAVVVYSGTVEQSLALTRHWNSILGDIAPRYCCYAKAEGELAAIGWTAGFAHGGSVAVLYEMDSIFWSPLMWVCIIAACALIISASFQERREGGRQAFLAIFATQAVFIAPLFYIANDYGRWIFLITATSVVAACMWDNDKEAPAPMFAARMPRLPTLEKTRAWLPLIALVGLAVPGCCWSIRNYAIATLPGRNIDSLTKLYVLLAG